MADIVNDVPSKPLSVEGSASFPRPNLWHRIVLGAIFLLSVFMNFFLPGQNGYGNS